jgi:hypothetical protein
MKKQKLKMQIIAILGLVLSSVLFYGGISGASLIASGCGGSSSSTTNTAIPAGWEGTAKYCNPSADNSTATGVLHIEATCITPSAGATGSTTMNENININFMANLGFASSGAFTTQQIYKQGTWKITKVQIMQLTGALPVTNIPRTILLPGSLGNPIFDFTGGTCQIQ